LKQQAKASAFCAFTRGERTGAQQGLSPECVFGFAFRTTTQG
jgi:hypothetical protein